MLDLRYDFRYWAIIDLLSLTGMRVGELVLLNREDIDFNEQECIVFRKGDKERIVYFDARTNLHLQEYLNSRIDDNLALFVGLRLPMRQGIYPADTYLDIDLLKDGWKLTVVVEFKGS